MKNYKIANFSKDPAGWKDGNPFHGDHYIIETMYEYIKQADIFIETGTAYAESSYFVADNFLDKKIYTCEVDDNRYNISKEVLQNFSNVDLQKIKSPDFLNYVGEKEPDLKNKKCVFWFDSHGEWYEEGQKKYSWPLRQEVLFVVNNLKNYAIFIDDFQNPFVSVSYDICGGHVCGPDEVKSVLNGAKLYHPTYTNSTSKYHSNIVGVGLITDMDIICDVAKFKENC
jgi:hypothetical protein